MKKRRSLVITFLLVTAIALGVGYAAVSDTLDIVGNIDANGSAMNNTFDGLVYFDTASATILQNNDEGTVTATANVSTASNDTANYGVAGLQKVGDSVKLSFVIQNDYTESVWITMGNHEPITDSALIVENNYNDTPVEIAAGDSWTFEVTITVDSLTSTDISISHNIQFNATDVAPTP